MALDLRETGNLLREKRSELEVHLDEIPGEQTFLSVYLGEEEYVDVTLEGEGAEFWHEGSKRQDIQAADSSALADAIMAWFEA